MRHCKPDKRPAHSARLRFCLLGLSALVHGTAALAQTETDCTRIRHISFDVQDVYPESPDSSDNKNTWFESTLNFMHFRTREDVVRQELLFREGDCYEAYRIEESARNLRAFSIFADARIMQAPVIDENAIDLHIITRDRFTLRAEISASHNAGTTKNRISVGDKNLFGRNKSLHFSHTKVEDEDTNRVTYKDNRIWQHYAMFTQHEEARGGSQQQLSLSRPFRSLDDRHAYGGSYERNDQDYVYSLDESNELEIPRFRESQSLFFTRELGDREQSHRVGVALHHSRQNFLAESSVLPPELPKRLQKTGFDISTALTSRDGFKVLKGLDSLIYREDIELSESWLFGAGAQWREEPTDVSLQPRFSLGYQHTHFMQERWLSATSWRNDWRLRAGDMREYNSTAFYHLYYLPSEQQTWVTGLTWQYHYARDELSDPVTMGGDVGLRGYEASAFTGNKSLLMNLEHRLRLPSPWQEVAFGQALFLDAGYAWDHGKNVRGADLKVNVGWGLRVDIPSLFGNNIVRFDVAMATDTGEVLATMVLGQVFRYNEMSEGNLKEF